MQDLLSFLDFSFLFNPSVVLTDSCNGQVEQAKGTNDDSRKVIYGSHQRIYFLALFHPRRPALLEENCRDGLQQQQQHSFFMRTHAHIHNALVQHQSFPDEHYLKQDAKKAEERQGFIGTTIYQPGAEDVTEAMQVANRWTRGKKAKRGRASGIEKRKQKREESRRETGIYRNNGLPARR
jgi:hypothetical protein